MLQALCTTEALLHTSYSFSGSCGGCGNNEVIIPYYSQQCWERGCFCPWWHQLCLCYPTAEILWRLPGCFYGGSAWLCTWMPGCILQDVSFWGQAPLVQGVITSAWHSCVKVRDVVRHFFLQPLEASQLIEGSSKVTSFCWTHPLSTTHIFSVSIFLGV